MTQDQFVRQVKLVIEAFDALPPEIIMRLILGRLNTIVVTPCACARPECQYKVLNDFLTAAGAYADHLDRYKQVPPPAVRIEVAGTES